MERFDVYARILEDLGAPIRPPARVLDLGCGAGGLIKAACERGFDGWGCDFESGIHADSVDPKLAAEMLAGGRLLRIEPPYRLPFEDATFDVVLSDQVFEHVQDFESTIAELHRVMKPGAIFLHTFPTRHCLLEGHLLVPLASWFHPRWWLVLWAALGVRNQFQHGLSVRETVERNERFLRDSVNYPPVHEVNRHFLRSFHIRNAEFQFMKVSRRAKLFILPILYRTFWQRVLFGVKP